MSFYSFVCKTLSLYFRLLFKLKVKGLENLVEGEALLAPNHASCLDPPLIAASVPGDLHFLAKDTLFHGRFLKSLLAGLHAHPVKRGEQNIETFKMIHSLLKDGKKMVIFPEGFRSSSGSLHNLEAGVAHLALRAGVPIVPIFISGTYEAWPRHKKWPSLTGKLSVTLGQPLFPDKFSHLSKKEAVFALTEELSKSLLALSVVAG